MNWKAHIFFLYFNLNLAVDVISRKTVLMVNGEKYFQPDLWSLGLVTNLNKLGIKEKRFVF